MIAIKSQSQEILKTFESDEDLNLIYHKKFGFLSSASLSGRKKIRKKSGVIEASQDQNLFDFKIQKKTGHLHLMSGDNCTVERTVEKIKNQWQVRYEQLNFFVEEVTTEKTFPIDTIESLEQETTSLRKRWPAALLILMGLLALYVQRRNGRTTEEVEVPQAPVVIQMEKPRPPEQHNMVLDKTAKAQKALTQNLGFLKLLGKKDLKKAMGGLPVPAPEVSPGAGAGGKESSGGELLAAAGQGLRRTTVGNSGMAGLGGIGTKGTGGGMGGYGDTDFSSGGGRLLSTVPLSQEATVEGGLDRSLIQATILRYLSQVRACYEEGLKSRPEIMGQVTMNFEINGRGGVNYSRVQKTSLNDKPVEDCISTRMLNWKFPTPRGGVDVKVSYPFMLRPVKS